jgi:hypothetical protein
MEWIAEYWYILLLGLITVMYLFGNRTKVSQSENVRDHQCTHADGKAHKSGHGCCGG